MTHSELSERISRAIRRHQYDPMNDVLFKFIFGKIERKAITIDFLNSVLEPSLGHTIRNIRFISTEMVPQNADEKLSRLDVACELDTGEFIDVEVQVVNYHNMERRTLYFEIHFLEIPKFINKPIRDMTKMERWMAYFSGKLNVQEKEELAMNEAAISDAYDATDVFFQSRKERMEYLNRQMAIMDYNYGLKSAEERGRKQEQNRMAKLARLLKEAGREEEAFRAMADPEMLERLYREFHLD